MNSSQLLRQRAAGFLKTLALILLLTSLTVILAFITMGKLFAAFCLGFIILVYLFTPKVAPGVLLRIFRARKIRYPEAPAIYRTLYYLSKKAGLISPPELYYIPSPKPLAFTTGDTEKSGIAVSSGLLSTLTNDEIAGVLAHELSHIANSDVQVMWFALIMNRATGFLSMMGQVLFVLNLPLIFFSGMSISWLLIVLLVFAPTLGYLIQLTLSRVREYSADMGAAELLGTPEPLISALVKIEYGQMPLFGNLFFRRQETNTSSFFMTHPPTEERIKRLKAFRVKNETSYGRDTSSPADLKPPRVRVVYRVPNDFLHHGN